MKRIAVKIGSNVLTRKDGTLDITRMSALVDQVADLHRQGMEIVLISSGAVASGRSEIKAGKKLDPVSARQLYSAVGQAKLINRYYELFREHGMTCGQVLTTKENFGSRTHYLNQKHCMEVMLENKVIPIVNENDTISVTELMFTDNDELSGLIATMMGMQAVFLAFGVPFLILLAALFITMHLTGGDELKSAIISLLALAPYYFIIYICRGKLSKKFSFTLEPIKNN